MRAARFLPELSFVLLALDICRVQADMCTVRFLSDPSSIHVCGVTLSSSITKTQLRVSFTAHAHYV